MDSRNGRSFSKASGGDHESAKFTRRHLSQSRERDSLVYYSLNNNKQEDYRDRRNREYRSYREERNYREARKKDEKRNCREDRNYNRNDYEQRKFGREDITNQCDDNYDHDLCRRSRDYKCDSRERSSMESFDMERHNTRNNYGHDRYRSRSRTDESNTQPRDHRPQTRNGNNNATNVPHKTREDELEIRASSEKDMDESQFAGNNIKTGNEAFNIIILFGVTKEITKADITSELFRAHMEPVCIRVIRKSVKDSMNMHMESNQRNSSHGIAFVEFNTVEEAKQWMEFTQGILIIGDQRMAMQYSHTRILDWNCYKCGVCNFKFRFFCFICKTPRGEGQGALTASSEGVDEVSQILTKKILLRNLDALTNEEVVLTALQQHLPKLADTVSKVRISRDALTQASRGICYLHFDTLVDSMELHNALTALDPPLILDERAVSISYCVDTDSCTKKPKASQPFISTAPEIRGIQRGGIAAVPPSQPGGSYTPADIRNLAKYSASLYATNPGENAYYVQYYTDYYTAEIAKGDTSDPQLTEANSGAAVALSAIQRKQKKMSNIETTATAAAIAAAQAAAEIKATFATQNVIAPRGNDGKTYPAPDVSRYQYDETSGYYFDSSTGLYYDAHSQYYYNNETGAYLYWDQRRSTYILATPASTQAALQEVLAEAEQKDDDSKKEKEKEKDKDKEKDGNNKHDKVKVAKKIVKDMEKWAKQLNQKKDYTVVATPHPILTGSEMSGPSTSRSTQGSYADVGFSILEKKERAKLTDFMPPAAPVGVNKLFKAYGGGSESDEDTAGSSAAAVGGSNAVADEMDYVDFQKLTCLLCKRAFQSLEILQKHLKMSNLHKENLAKLNQGSGASAAADPDLDSDAGLSYRDRAKERRLKYGESDPPPPNRSRERFEQEIKTLQTRQKNNGSAASALPISSSNVGNRLMQKMGWTEGQGLGRKNQGRTQIIEADGRTKSVGLGNKVCNLPPGTDYKSYIKKMMKQRYENA